MPAADGPFTLRRTARGVSSGGTLYSAWLRELGHLPADGPTTAQDFRRMFITDAIRTGLPPHVAQVIAGHADINRPVEIRDNLLDRMAAAEREGWFGEIEGLRAASVAAPALLRACRTLGPGPTRRYADREWRVPARWWFPEVAGACCGRCSARRRRGVRRAAPRAAREAG